MISQFSSHVLTKEERIGWYISAVRKINFQLAQTGRHLNQLILQFRHLPYAFKCQRLTLLSGSSDFTTCNSSASSYDDSDVTLMTISKKESFYSEKIKTVYSLWSEKTKVDLKESQSSVGNLQGLRFVTMHCDKQLMT